MSSPAKRKRDDSTSPTPTNVTKYEHCDFDGARVARITLQSPPSPIQRGLKFFGLRLRRYEYNKKKRTCICSNCSSKAITKAYTPTKYDNIVFEGGCLKLLDISYYSDRPSGKSYYVINRRWFPVGEDGCCTLKGGYFGDGMKVQPIGNYFSNNKSISPIGSMQELINNHTKYPPDKQLLEQKYGSLHYIRAYSLGWSTKGSYFVVVKDITTPPQSSSIYKLRQKCQSQLYLETQMNLANAGLAGYGDKEYYESYKDYFNNEEKMMKSVEFAFRELINCAELLCTYAKQLKDAAQRGEEYKEQITIFREELVKKNGSYHWVTNPGMDPDGPRFKKFNATHWDSVFKGIDWYRPKNIIVGTFVKTGTGFITEGTQWKSECFPYETMEDAFAFFTSESYSSHPWHHHSTTIEKIYNKINQIYSNLNKFCRQAFGNKQHNMINLRGYLPLCESMSDADVVLALEKASDSMHQSAKDISTIIKPMQGTYYSKSWAVQMVIKQLQSSNKSTQSAVINDMITSKRIPDTSAQLLSNLVRSKKKGKFFIDDEWKTVRSNRKCGLALALVHVETHFDTYSLYKPPTLIHLSNYFGIVPYDREGSSLGYWTLYFSPRQFPTPVDLSQAVSCDSFECLRSYIVEQSKKEGEVSGTLAKNGKSVRFACKHKKCKFYFVLKWDELGYYIHYHKYSRGDKFIGCLEHSH